MTERVCDEQEMLIGYLYGELPPAERRMFTRHLQQCGTCREALDGFVRVREGLGAWEAPDIALDIAVAAAVGPRAATTAEAELVVSGDRRASAPRALWRPWVRAAAIVLLAGAGMAVANVRVTISTGAVTLSSGWLAPSPAASGAASLPQGSAGRPPVGDAPADHEWRAALSRLESSLRDELAAVRSAAPAASAERIGGPVAAPVSIDRVRTLIAESEQRQQRELALRLTQFGRDVDQQRRTDLVRINQGFGQFEGRAGAEIARQRQMLDYIMRVSAPPPPQ